MSQALLRHAAGQVRLALLVVLAVLGMAAAYPFTGGSRAAIAGTTTTPSPDAPPTTTAAPKPDAVRHTAPPPPAQTYAPPPPPPAVEAAKPRHVAVTPSRSNHRPTRAVERQKARAAGSAPRLLRPPPPTAAAASAIGPLTTSDAGLSGTVWLFLAALLTIALLVAGLALVPAEVLPTPIFDLVVARREVLVSAAAALVLGLAAVLVVLAVS